RRQVRVPDAVRDPPRPAVLTLEGRLRHAHLRPVRPRVVPVLHAPPRRAARERGIRASRSVGGARTVVERTERWSAEDDGRPRTGPPYDPPTIVLIASQRISLHAITSSTFTYSTVL